jgi:hypothetical protein
MKRSRRLATGAALCGTVVLTVGVAVGFGGLGSPRNQPGNAANGPAITANAQGAVQAAAAVDGGVSVVGKTTPALLNVATADPSEPAVVPAAVFSADAAVVEVSLPEPSSPVSPPVAASEAPPVEVATANPTEPVEDEPREVARASEPLDECLVVDVCIDDYLWSLYERTPKRDTVKEHEQRKVTVKKKGKTRTVTKTITKLVDEDFTWKDPKAADRAGLSMKDYVIGGMDRSFKVKLFRAMRAMDEAGLVPGITSAFRDDYRQSIASGLKAASNRSFHGGSTHGGYGHGLAADIVSVRGATRSQRQDSSEVLWKWVDAHGKEYGIGRPYLDHDPPHVGPIDGKEYAGHRGSGAHTKHAGVDKKKHARVAARADHAIIARRAKAAKASRLSAI